jgi:hypothetical protein
MLMTCAYAPPGALAKAVESTAEREIKRLYQGGCRKGQDLGRLKLRAGETSFS